MPLTPGSEEVATGITGLALALFAKFKFVTKSDFATKQLDCQTHLSEKIDSMAHTQEKNFTEVFDKLHGLTLHQGKVEQYMKMKNGD